MNSLPSGTVTFLFTDIEGSTKLAQEHPEAMPALLARHHAILNHAIEAHNGYVFQIVGDAFCAAFHSVSDALNAGLEAQQYLYNESWSPATIRVRMGLHTGFAESHEEGYRGYLTLARVQRVMSCGHGGQILLSLDIAEQARERLPQGAGLRDLGWHYLKGISQAEHLFQLVTDDLPSNFPPLKSTPVAPSVRKEVFSVLDHIVRGQLIGRESEMSELEGFWNRAERGEGHLVLLSGEPGVGKTRLVEELTALATLRGALVLEGHFHPELGVTYLGLREALQDYLRSLSPDQARGAIGSTAPELVKLVPEVEAIVGSITPNPPMGELEAERLRLFDHVTQFLIRLTKKTPMLFVLEDLHWADGPSLLFLHFLLRNTRQVPILVLGTYRETELDPVRPFYETLLGMNRDRLYTRVALHGLDEKNVERLVSALLDGQVEAPLVSAITRDTEGNPFFIEEVVKGLVERNSLRQERGVWKPIEEVEHFIPQSIQIALGKRLETLSDDARAALSLASVLGREFDMDILLGMSEWDEDRLLDALDEAAKAQLITELSMHGKEAYRFSHALLAQVIYDAINTRRRTRFHQQAGKALENVHARKLDEQIEALAYHYSRSPSSAADKAVTYGLRAAEKAVAVYAHDQAIRYYTEVLEALHDLDDPQTEARAWELMGDAKLRLYYAKEAIEAFENALSVLEKAKFADGHEYCRLSYKLGELIIREQKDSKRARAHLERALASPAASPESPQRAKCLATLAICLVQEGALEEAQAQAETAIELAERLQYSDGIASGCGALCNVFEARGDLASYAQTSERQMEALNQGGDLYGIFDAYGNIISLSWQRGDYAQMENFSLAGMDLCRKFNAPGWEGTILAGYLFMLNFTGRWDEALKHGERVLPLFERVGCSSCFMFIFRNLAEIEAKRGNRERSRQYMNSAHDIASQLSQLLPEPDADIRWKFFDLVIHEEWDAAWNSVEEYRAAGYPLLSATSTSKSLWSLMLPETAARAKHWPEAERLARDAIIMFEGIGAKAAVANSHLALGLVHAGQHKWDEALAEFQQALDGYQTLGHPWDIANTKYETGLAHAVRGGDGDQDYARQEFEEALKIFTELKAQPAMDKVNAALGGLQ
jgi:predicted ATPase/class 3 adenylate cyclase